MSDEIVPRSDNPANINHTDSPMIFLSNSGSQKPFCVSDFPSPEFFFKNVLFAPAVMYLRKAETSPPTHPQCFVHWTPFLFSQVAVRKFTSARH